MADAIPIPPLPTLFGRATLVNDQHLALRRTFQRLREICAVAGVRDPAGRVVARMVGELHTQLLAHFAAEEAGEYFDTIAADCPWERATIARLRAEHRQMLRSLEKLAALGAEPDRTTELGAALERLFDQFQSHEREETRLVQEFLFHDERAEDANPGT